MKIRVDWSLRIEHVQEPIVLEFDEFPSEWEIRHALSDMAVEEADEHGNIPYIEIDDYEAIEE